MASGNGAEARNDITVAIRNWFANRNPLVTRLPYVPVERVDFTMFSHKFRARSTTLATSAISSGATTSITVADNTFLMNHDVLSWVDGTTGAVEYFQVSADPNGDGSTLTVSRAVSGTTAATNVPVGATVTLVGNARTGAEIDQTALTTNGVPRTQYCQTFQFPVDIGGSALTTRAFVLPGGIQSPLDFNMTMQLQNMVDDIENALYYGIKDAPTGTVTAKMNGLREILATNNISVRATNKTPVNAGAYTPQDLIRDTIQACKSGGGDPDLMLVSTSFISGLSTWGQAVQRIPAGETVYGTPIEVIKAPFLGDVTLIEAPLLNAASPSTAAAICLTSSEVYIRNKRNPYWQLRGARGDRVQGDWIAELSIEVVNESHHAYVEGISSFAA